MMIFSGDGTWSLGDLGASDYFFLKFLTGILPTETWKSDHH